MEKITHQFCPVRDIIARLSDKWSMLVIITLKHGNKMRFNEIQKEIDGISQRMLTITLRSLQSDGLISRRVYAEVPPRVEYKLTDRGHSLMPSIEGLVEWALVHCEEIQQSRKDFERSKLSL